MSVSRSKWPRPRVLGAALFILVAAGRLAAMDRWAALSMLESGDNDHAVGGGGEVSRYQIKPALWNLTVPGRSSPRDPGVALAVAQSIMRSRCAAFENRVHRAPTDFEFYVLWNAPAQLLGTNAPAAPSKAVAARARRFCNLVAEPHR